MAKRQRGSNNKESYRNGKGKSGSNMKRNEYTTKNKNGESEGVTTYGKESYDANDPKWYIPNEQLLNDAAAIPYSIPLGNSIDIGLPTGDDASATFARTVPGVMTFHMYAGPGRSNSVPDAINVAANMIYSKIRANISGTRPYDAPDVMMYLMGADHAYMFLSWMQRLYGIMNVYSSVNRYLPKALIDAQGVDFDNLRDNLSNFRYYINNFALQLASLYVPADLPIFKRHYWLYQNVWTDSESAMSQIYLYAPAGFGTYEEKTSEKGGTIKFNGSYQYGKATKWSVPAITVFGDRLLEKLIYSEDVGTICGDIRRTYGESNSLVPSTIDEAYSVVPAYNKEVLSQIENTFCIGTQYSTSTIKSLDVVQDPATNNIRWNLNFTLKNDAFGKILKEFYTQPHSYYLSSHGTATTPADNIVMTRFMNAALEYSGQDMTVTSCGSEIVLDILIASVEGENIEYRTLSSVISKTDVGRAILISKFDWHPIFYVFDTTPGSDGKFKYAGVLGDLDTFTLIPRTQLVRLNDMACMGLFNVPYRG